MSAAETAIANAIPIEVKKDGLQQRQNGDWVLRLVVQAADMDSRLTNAPMGTRFQAVLVEVGDDELPKEQPKQRIDWREVQPTAQAAIRCADPHFRRYLLAEHGIAATTTEDAATAVRKMCGVNSRAVFATNHKARMLWNQIDSQYREWAHL